MCWFQLNSSLLETVLKTVAERLKEIGLHVNKQTNKTVKINGVKTMKRTPQNKNSSRFAECCTTRVERLQHWLKLLDIDWQRGRLLCNRVSMLQQ